MTISNVVLGVWAALSDVDIEWQRADGITPQHEFTRELARELTELRAKAAAGKWVPLEPTKEIICAIITQFYVHRFGEYTQTKHASEIAEAAWQYALAAVPEAEKP